jgi:DNA-binding winged helix-turn-helix (wHTH) protein
MKPARFCPKCGADILLDEPIRIDDFAMIGEQFPLCYRAQPIHLTRSERIVVWSILKAFPKAVSKPTLLDRLDSDGVNNTIQVLICRIRKKIMDIGGPDTIETVRGEGYRWRPVSHLSVAERLTEGDIGIGEVLVQLYGVPSVGETP